MIYLNNIYLKASGQWSGEQPTCKHSNGGAHSPYYCSQPPIIKHASHNGSQEQEINKFYPAFLFFHLLKIQGDSRDVLKV